MIKEDSKMSKIISTLVSFLLVMAACASTVHAEEEESRLYNENKLEVKRAILDMNINDLNQIQAKLKKVAEESARKTGYVKGSPMGGGGGFYYFMPSPAINDNKPMQLDDITYMLGGAGGFLYNVHPKLAVGGLFGGMTGWSEKSMETTSTYYWHFNIWSAFQMLHAQYKPILNDDYIIGIDLAAGIAESGYSLYQTDESFNGQDVYRLGISPAYLYGIDIRKRLSNIWHAGIKYGYFTATVDNLSRADRADPLRGINLNSTYLALSMGGNF
jgi:hypothetical protein